MLVFTRKLDEAIVIGDGVEVRVLRVGKDSVRIGVSAAPHVPVHRREIYDQIKAANVSAVADADSVDAVIQRLRKGPAAAPYSSPVPHV
ncbi:MAG: carbon storage regulator [Acidobacteria bacterium 37-65-4]|nr:MAG: carbon storage regulator [Acidobacteria bacterium 37-65-4]